MKDDEHIFFITVEWVQSEAERLNNRRLTDLELYSVKKGLESGLLRDIDVIMKTSIENAVRDYGAREAS